MPVRESAHDIPQRFINVQSLKNDERCQTRLSLDRGMQRVWQQTNCVAGKNLPSWRSELVERGDLEFAAIGMSQSTSIDDIEVQSQAGYIARLTQP